MKRTFISFIALMLAILLSANCIFAQFTPYTDMSKYIALTVGMGDSINLALESTGNIQTVKIVSGSWDTTLAVGQVSNWQNSKLKIKARTPSMTIYGRVKSLDCSSNGAKITQIDASHDSYLKYLNCRANLLTSLNVSGLTNLETLQCHDNRLTSLDVSGLTNLKDLKCFVNNLTTLNVSGLTNLEILNCRSNQLTSLDVSGLTNLKTLACNYNKISSLNLSGCTNLSYLNCARNQLTNLDVSNLTMLDTLFCSSNLLTALNLNGHTALTVLDFQRNQLTTLNVSGCTSLLAIWAMNNQLTGLDISSLSSLRRLEIFGNNLTTQAIDELYCQLPDRTSMSRKGQLDVSVVSTDAVVLATNKSNATAKNWKVCVADTTTSTTTYTDFPATNGTYNCQQEPEVDMSKYITLTVTQGDSINIGMGASADNTPIKIVSGTWDTIITANSGNAIQKKYKSQSTTMTIYGDITMFSCTQNSSKVTVLDASHNTSLTKLYCSGNQLTSLDVSGLTNLGYLDCYNSLLTSLNVSGCTNLNYLNCTNNHLTSLDVSGCINLEYVECYGNQLTSLNVSGLTNLEHLECDGNQLTSLNVSGLTNLGYLDCYTNQLTSLNVNGCTSLEYLDCEQNQLTSLDVSGLTSLEELYCTDNQLTSLDVDGCNNLKDISCSNNQMSTQTIDNLYCQLPDRASQTQNGEIVIATSSTDEMVLATNKTNATNKNWKVFWINTTTHTNAEVVTNGTYVCGEEPCIPVVASITETLCYGETFTFNGQTYNATGTYTTTVAGQNGDCDTNYTINLTILPQNTASVTETLCYGETFTFNGQTYNATGTYTTTVAGQNGDCDTLYTINLTILPQNEPINEEVTISQSELPYEYYGETYNDFGTYSVTIQDENGCDQVYNLTLVHNSGISEVEGGLTISLYPNPTDNNATLRVKGLNEQATIIITDQQGRVVSTKVLAEGVETMEIESEKLASGVYYLQVKGVTTKFIKK